MNKITDVFVLGILWFLFSIPVITAGAATTSLYQFTLKQADDEEGYVFKSFVRAFTKNFKQATILWLLVLAAAGFLAVDLWACMQIAIPSWVRVVFPVLSRFHLPIKTILPHSFIMAMGNLYISVTVLVTYIIFGVLSFYIPILFPVFMALAAFISSYLFRYVFTRYQEDGEDQ